MLTTKTRDAIHLAGIVGWLYAIYGPPPHEHFALSVVSCCAVWVHMGVVGSGLVRKYAPLAIKPKRAGGA